MQSFYVKLNQLLAAGKRLVVATVVSTHGSAPRKTGAKMIIAETSGANPEIHFSIGGGPFEAMVIEAAKLVLQTEAPRLEKFQLNENDQLGLKMTCGGTVDVFLEPAFPDRRLVIFGAGTVGCAVVEKAAGLGFSLQVIDDRPERLAMIRDKVATSLTDSKYETNVPDLKNAFVVIVTRCHEVDKMVLRRIVSQPTSYLGLIGSKGKVRAICKELEQEDGFTAETWRKLHAPIGLPIGGDSADEIAISILSELVLEKNKLLAEQALASERNGVMAPAQKDVSTGI